MSWKALNQSEKANMQAWLLVISHWQSNVVVYIANPSKLTEKYILDLRNLFSNQENIGIFFSKQENKLTEKKFLVSAARKLDLN